MARFLIPYCVSEYRFHVRSALEDVCEQRLESVNVPFKALFLTTSFTTRTFTFLQRNRTLSSPNPHQITRLGTE